jgi:DNA-directed RNA polymerase sigma subunit (sigma70/sigma32)
MGVSKERVRQLEMRAIRKLQKHFQLRREERREAAAV